MYIEENKDILKGIVFTEFLDLVDDRFGWEVTESIIEKSKSNLSTGGAYTSIGTYPYSEIFILITNLSLHAKVSISKLMKAFGQHLFKRFATNYAVFFENIEDTFTFLKSVDNHIHVEVKKLYPEAEFFKVKIIQIS